jgi:hypothetical protein
MHGCLQTIALPVVALDKLDLFVTAEVALSLCEGELELRLFCPKRFTSDMYIVGSDRKAADQREQDSNENSHRNAPSQYGCASIVNDPDVDVDRPLLAGPGRSAARFSHAIMPGKDLQGHCQVAEVVA